ncbi:MAG: O-acetyl-ADP-ribose deacetylase, partial [Nitrospiraceae bacterium]
DEQGFESIAIPGMGMGVGGVDPIDAARLMVNEAKRFPARSLKKVVLVDVDSEMVKAWREQIAES